MIKLAASSAARLLLPRTCTASLVNVSTALQRKFVRLLQPTVRDFCVVAKATQLKRGDRLFPAASSTTPLHYSGIRALSASVEK